MKNNRCLLLAIPLAAIMGFQTAALSQSNAITVYQYRRVPADKAEEFVKRETTYWAEVAKKAMTRGNLTQWVLLERVGGLNMENAPNYMFVNTYNNIDDVASVWDTRAAFPNVTADKMETNSMSTVTAMVFLQGRGWQQKESVADGDFSYVHVIYHNASDPVALLDLENKHWAPFIKSTMDKGQTTQVGWGNALVLTPAGPDVPFNSVSYDLYPSLKEALHTTIDPNVVFPEAGLTEITKLELTRRVDEVYRVVKAVNAE